MRERINGVVPVETKVNAKAAKSTHLVIMFLRNLIWVFIKLIVLEVKLIYQNVSNMFISKAAEQTKHPLFGLEAGFWSILLFSSHIIYELSQNGF